MTADGQDPDSVAGPEEVPVDYEPFNRSRDLQRGLSVAQVSQWLRAANADVIRMAEAGEIPGRLVGGQWRFGILALNDWIEHRATSPTAADAEHSGLRERLLAMEAAWGELASRIDAALAPIHQSRAAASEDGQVTFAGPFPTIDQLERAYIQHVLRMHDGNKGAAARVLGIDPATLYRKLKDILL